MTLSTTPVQSNSKANPANIPDKQVRGRERVPMSLPVQKLAVPEIPGYHTHWMEGTQLRINQALKAGYEFVSPEEVDSVTSDLAGDPLGGGSTDLGSRVSLMSGMDDQNNAIRLYLMKLPQEFWEEDQASILKQSEKISEALGGGNIAPAEASYVKSQGHMFQRKK